MKYDMKKVSRSLHKSGHIKETI